ncbi:MAG: hypothetical protein RL338_9, partial [Chloroflexota bacterium]
MACGVDGCDTARTMATRARTRGSASDPANPLPKIPEADQALVLAALEELEVSLAICDVVRDGEGAIVGAKVRYANRLARERWRGPGTALDQVAGEDLYALAPHTRSLERLGRRVVETGTPFTGVVPVEHAWGRRFLDLHLARLGDGFVVTSRDVTEKELVEQTLREREARFRVELAASEERFRAALDATLDTLAILRTVRDARGEVEDFEIVYANRAWQEVHGHPGVDPVGRRLYAEYPAFTPLREFHLRTVETNEPLRRTFEVEGPSRRWHEFQLTKFGDGYVTASRDVTDRVVAEAALSANEERLRDIIAGIDAIISLEDERTGEAYVSPQAERILGYPPEKLAQVDFWKSRILPEDAAWVVPIWDEETSEYELEYRMLDANDRVVWLRERVIHQIDPESGLNRWFGVAFDITERHVLEDQMERARRMESLGRLASGVAHDFNNLLYGISLLAEYLVRGLPEGPLQTDAKEIVAAVARGSALTRQLLSFARGRSGEPEPTDVAAVVAGVGSMLGHVLGGGIAMEIESEPIDGLVVLDRHGLEQALVNLATNARDAMPEGGRLLIRTDGTSLTDSAATARDVEPGRYARIVVSDSGVGISPEIAPRIFEPFATTKPVETGTGLGLSNVYSFVRSAGGS